MGLGVKFRAHPLAIGIASVQLKKLDELNANRRAYIQEISDGLQEIQGVSPVETCEGQRIRRILRLSDSIPRSRNARPSQPQGSRRPSEKKGFWQIITRIHSLSVMGCRCFQAACQQTAIHTLFSIPCRSSQTDSTSTKTTEALSVRSIGVAYLKLMQLGICLLLKKRVPN